MSAGDEAPVGGNRPTVFLSYARADQTQAAALMRALEEAGLDVWWDALIEGGAAFAKSIEAALTRCDVVMVAWSATSVTSDWVRDEAARGRDLRKLVPVSLDGTPPPLGFGQYHSIDLSRWRGTAGSAEIADVIRSIASTTRKSIPKPQRTAKARPASAFLSRRALLASTAGLAVAGIAGFIAWRRGLIGGGVPASGNSVAVLPFENLSGDPNQAYFSDGLSEEVRATLARNVLLLVMAETSSGKFRDHKDDARTIAEKLGVAFLLDGSVRRAGDVVRVAADLIDGETGFSRWSRTFDRSMHDIFAVQSEIADAVAGALAAQVTATGVPAAATAQELASSGGTTNVAAYDDYLRGRALYDLSSDETAERAALARFDAAIAADPSYAAAHAARSRSLTAIANQYGEAGQLAGLYDAAVKSAERAIALAPRFADAYSTLGLVLFQGRLDAHAAREPFERSREFGPGDANVLARYSLYSARIGRKSEAADAMRRALVLDPLNPLIHRAAGAIQYAARNYADSIPPAEHALSMNPRMSRAHAAIGDALLMLGRTDDARAAYAAEPSEDVSLAGKAIVEWKLGNATAARAAMAKLVADLGDRVLYQQGQILAQWGEKDAALARLGQARIVGDSGLIYARNDPMLDTLRNDPRFARLLASIGFD
ncbi:MAG TPA: TIR domain-containing protein [Steroidobacteraceae bacterium]|nr:TIR domain-containing protein [Steroidobacteraceae bacterium]